MDDIDNYREFRMESKEEQLREEIRLVLTTDGIVSRVR